MGRAVEGTDMTMPRRLPASIRSMNDSLTNLGMHDFLTPTVLQYFCALHSLCCTVALLYRCNECEKRMVTKDALNMRTTASSPCASL